jgi:hypothetical protein
MRWTLRAMRLVLMGPVQASPAARGGRRARIGGALTGPGARVTLPAARRDG